MFHFFKLFCHFFKLVIYKNFVPLGACWSAGVEYARGGSCLGYKLIGPDISGCVVAHITILSGFFYVLK